MAYQPPTAEQAQVFAELMAAGVPSSDAIRVANPELDPVVVVECARRWEKDAAVRAAQVTLNGNDWRGLSDQQRIELALRKHYNEMAYFLATHHYGEIETAKQAKADKCRDALEKKLAGTSGKADAVSQFMEQFQKKVLAGELKLAPKAATH
jgi:hypothetical protein